MKTTRKEPFHSHCSAVLFGDVFGTNEGSTFEDEKEVDSHVEAAKVEAKTH
jgi:hypothetical protein